MRLDRISTDDIIEARVRGRVILGRVTEINDGIVHFDPISRGAGWRHAKAREIVAHWRKTCRRSISPAAADEQSDAGPPAAARLRRQRGGTRCSSNAGKRRLDERPSAVIPATQQRRQLRG